MDKKQSLNMKVTEVTYGLSILVKTEEFENIRSHIEVKAELGEDANMVDCINILRGQVKDISRNEYIEIKRKNRNKKTKNNSNRNNTTSKNNSPKEKENEKETK